MEKRGLSMVVSTVILIVLVMAAVTIVWVAVRGIIDQRIGESEACFDIFEKVKINNEFTCYDSSSQELQIFVEVKNIELDKLLISITGEGQTKSIDLYDGATYTDVKPYGGSYEDSLTIPGKEAGLTYVVILPFEPASIKLAPIINGIQCDASDTLFNIDSCSLLA